MARAAIQERRRWLLIIVAALAVLLGGFTLVSGFFIDLLWFREVHFTNVFWTILWTKLGLGLAFGALFAVILYANLLVVRRLTPKYRALTPDQEIVERYRLAFDPYLWWALPLLAVVLGIFVGVGVSAQWRSFLLWRNSSGVTFGYPDPQLHRDAGFYVFRLPWLEFLQGWLFSSLAGITLLVAIAHYLWGGIRPQSPTERVTLQVQAHLSVLIGLIVLVKAWGYFLGRFDLLTSARGVVTGASYTDVKAQLPALNLLLWIALFCAALFIANAWLRRWAIPIIGVGLLALASVAVGWAYPSYVQRFKVQPQEQQREGPYIKRNIDATRRAFGLDRINPAPSDIAPAVTPQEVTDNPATISNIRLFQPDILTDNYAQLQRFKQYYEFKDVDVDRYPIGGERRVVMLSARQISQDGLQPARQTWQNRHLVYTHGYGAVASQVNTATAEGAPLFTLSNIPPVGEPQLIQPRVYYGEGEEVPFVVVKTGSRELDYEGAPRATYTGKGGIAVGGLLRRAMFAWKYRDVNLLISGQITGDSKIMIYRDIVKRIAKAAPFLLYDKDPYAAVVGGRLVFIQDAYTTTNRFPYSQSVDLSEATGGGVTGAANYMRNSVKVVVDAYDGTMRFYVADPNDPIIQVWERAFPDLFTSFSGASTELKAHFRYPENLFQVQAAQFTNYHITNPNVFYQGQDVWQVPIDPTIQANASAAPKGTMRPYYVLMRLPGETQEEFVLLLPFTPANRQNMVAWIAAKSDPGPDYGHFVGADFSAGSNVDGPEQVFAMMKADPRFSAQQTLLGQVGSTVRFGDFLAIPIGDSFLYVQPVFVESNQNPIPELKSVLVVAGSKVGFAPTFAGALADALGGQPQGGGQPPTGSVQDQIRSLIQQALQHFANADQALRNGDLATYQSELGQAQKLIQQANDLAKQPQKGGATPTPAPSSTASPTP